MEQRSNFEKGSLDKSVLDFVVCELCLHDVTNCATIRVDFVVGNHMQMRYVMYRPAVSEGRTILTT